MQQLKITTEIRQDRNGRKKIWDNINKLRGRTTSRDISTILYDAEEQPLNTQEVEVDIEQYWTNIYRRHDNDTTAVWNEDIKCAYKEQRTKELQEDQLTYNDHTFPTILREHFDSDIQIGNIIKPMDYPQISRQELCTYLNNIKKNKATGPDGIKGELYRALRQSDICVLKLQRILQNILDNEQTIETWKKSNTKMIPKCKKPTAKQLRPMYLTSYL